MMEWSKSILVYLKHDGINRLSWDFEVLLCPDWIKFAQSVWATSGHNLSSELKLISAISVSEASHLGYNKFR